MTTLETNPIAFFFRPLSSTPGRLPEAESLAGIAELSISALTVSPCGSRSKLQMSQKHRACLSYLYKGNSWT